LEIRVYWEKELALTFKEPGIQRPVSPVGLIQMCRLTTGIRSEKCIIRWFCRHV